MPDLSTTELAGYRVLCAPSVEQALIPRLLPDPERAAREGTILRESNYRVTARVSIDRLGAVLLKVHHGRGLVEKVLSLVRPGKARAEWGAARLLHSMGFPVAVPLAQGERRRFRVLGPSFFAARFVEGMTPFREALNAQPLREARSLMKRSARLVRALHDRGFDHRDLHGGNILVGKGPGTLCRLLVVDLHRSRAGHTVLARARVDAIARWLHSLAGGASQGGRMRWVRTYLGDASRAQVRDMVARVERAIRRIERKRRRSRGKRCLKRSTTFTRRVGEGLRGARRRSLDESRLHSVLSAHDDAIAADDIRVAKRARKGIVTLHGDVVVKEVRPADWFGRVRDFVAPDRHRTAYVHAHQLDVVGVKSAKPMAYVRRGNRTFSLFEDLSRLERLDHLARRLFRLQTRADRRRLLHESADWLARLHQSGVYHGDVKGINVLVDTKQRRWSFHLIDTDRCRFFDQPVDERRRIKNLAQLAASIPVVVTKTDRLRWFRRYARSWAQSAPRRAFERRVARGVAQHLAQKIVVVDEPIE